MCTMSPMLSVALLAEGVDRNLLADCWGVLNVVSPSSRRAWIEMFLVLRSVSTSSVALLAEGVDRNRDAGDAGPFSGQSPSSRRAWIEIPMATPCDQALQSRPPRGGRG